MAAGELALGCWGHAMAYDMVRDVEGQDPGMTRHRPQVAAAITGLLVALTAWAAAVLPVPDDVQLAVAGVGTALAPVIGALAGRWAERRTWAEDTHAAAVAYATSLDPDEWVDVLRRAGLPSRAEALRIIGALPEDG